MCVFFPFMLIIPKLTFIPDEYIFSTVSRPPKFIFNFLSRVVIAHFPFNHFFLSLLFFPVLSSHSTLNINVGVCSDASRIVFVKFIFITYFPVCFP